ncbi:MAG TPA: CHAT domain-containing protein [Pyrinomonadaceae bacterium]|nr:CHAT domain-containing protein [Pyrinomonadaceae bacterium]
MPSKILLALALLISAPQARGDALRRQRPAPPPSPTVAPATNSAEACRGSDEAFDAAVAEHRREYLQFLERKISGAGREQLQETLRREGAGVKLESRGGQTAEGLGHAVFQATNHDARTRRVLSETLARAYAPATAVLFYFHDDKAQRLDAWLVDAKGIRAQSSVGVSAAELTRRNDSLRGALGVTAAQMSRAPRLRDVAPATPAAAPTNPEKAIAAMTETLLPPCLARALEGVEDLIVVPVLDLGTTPFAVLRPFGSREFLIERATLYVAPSLFEIGEETGAWSPQFTKALVVGNPDFTNKTRWHFPKLDGAHKEARAIIAEFGGTLLDGPRATKRAVRERAPEADLLYFATHGTADAADSRRGSFLVLSAEGEDLGLWTMEEILQQRFRARLAVLSACQTGLGERYKGGVMALGRTFQVAGVPRVVMSLWKVEDEATAELMRAFTANLRRKELPARALRLAMSRLARTRPPSVWASFVFFGTPEKISR